MVDEVRFHHPTVNDWGVRPMTYDVKLMWAIPSQTKQNAKKYVPDFSLIYEKLNFSGVILVPNGESIEVYL